MLKIEGKEKIVKQRKADLGVAQSVLLMDSVGLDANNANALRTLARKRKVQVFVVKNTLLRRAVEGTQFEQIKPHLVGSVIVLISTEGPSDAAKVVVDFSKDMPDCAVKVISLGGQHVLPGSELVNVSKMPTKQEALMQFAAELQSPLLSMTGLLGTISMHLLSTFERLLVKKTNDSSKGG